MKAARLLDAASVTGYLVERQLASSSRSMTAVALSGGVSSVVLLVNDGSRKMVVKQALPRLRVEGEWYADPRRALVEAEALLIAERCAPGWAPTLIDVDHDAFAIVISYGPPTHVNWRDELLTGHVRTDTGKDLGTFLAAWHHGALLVPPGSALRDEGHVIDLRVAPYYWSLLAVHPDLAEIASRTVRSMLDTKICLVHGDFSPKNILVGEGRPFVLDFEVAHLGDPIFDVAFMLHHLMLKSIHVRAQGEALRATAQDFVDTYERAATSSIRAHMDSHELFRQVGLLLLARIDGKSRVQYLYPQGEQSARAVGRLLALSPPASVDEAWDQLQRATVGRLAHQ